MTENDRKLRFPSQFASAVQITSGDFADYGAIRAQLRQLRQQDAMQHRMSYVTWASDVSNIT